MSQTPQLLLKTLISSPLIFYGMKGKGKLFLIKVEVQLHYFSNLISTSVVFWTFLLELRLMQARRYWNKLKVCISSPNHIIKMTVAVFLTVQTIQSREGPYGESCIKNSLQQLKLAVPVGALFGKSKDGR